MTQQVKDLPHDQNNTAATRLRDARELMGYSRAELAKRTGIPAKSIEKFEYGSQEPSISRLQALATALEVSPQWIMGEGDQVPVKGKLPAWDNTTEAADVAPPLPRPENEPVNENDLATEVRVILDTLDDMRSEMFEGTRRRAMALADNAKNLMRNLEPDELLELADERGLHKCDGDNEESITALFADGPDKGQEYCGSIEDRILDTAILGVDLYAVDRDALVKVADDHEDEHDIERPAWLGLSWGEHSEFVPLIRVPLLAQAYSGNAMQLVE